MPKVRKVMSLQNKDDFLMHGVVLQNRVFQPAHSMFHVKHPCVKGLSSQSERRDVSRETVFSSTAQPRIGARCFT
jgi:hypothetical protein